MNIPSKIRKIVYHNLFAKTLDDLQKNPVRRSKLTNMDSYINRQRFYTHVLKESSSFGSEDDSPLSAVSAKDSAKRSLMGGSVDTKTSSDRTIVCRLPSSEREVILWFSPAIMVITIAQLTVSRKFTSCCFTTHLFDFKRHPNTVR